MEDKLLSLIKCFKLTGNIRNVEIFGNGHINKTYHVITTDDEYVLQQINHYAFKDVQRLMNNVDVVTSFIKNRGYETLEVIPTTDNKLYTVFEGEYYRVYRFIKNATSYETVGNDLSLVEKLGEAFGQFHHLLSGLNANLLNETIRNFHNTPSRYIDFSSAYIHADEDRKEYALKEAEYIFDHGRTYSKIVDGIKNHTVKEHVTHNDPKINNILFDKDSKEVRCVIDLDTVMPGSFLYDIGDAFRSLFSGDNEDNKDTSLLKVNLDIFTAYMKSYLKEMKDDLTKKEIELIPYSIYLMTIECGMRFLEDYLKGNVYFHVAYDEHNLVRCRTQIALAEDILKNQDKLSEIIKEILGELNGK